MSLTVILAEDDLDIQLVARLALKRAGFVVKVVNNGQEALDAVKAEPPDVILLDWMMPELRRTRNLPPSQGGSGYCRDPGRLPDRKVAGSRDTTRAEPRRRRLRHQAVRCTDARRAREGHRRPLHSVKIRTRAFLALWLITILVAGTIGVIVFALNIASGMDAERQRLSEILNVHGALWRALVELKHDQHDLAVLDLPSIRERLRNERIAVNEYLAHEASLVTAPDQVNRIQELRLQLQKWSETWDTAVPQSGSPEVLLTLSEADFAPVSKLLADFDRRERELWEESIRELASRRTLFFSILAAMTVMGMTIMAWLMLSTKRVILDPLTELTGAARRIEHGDFSGAHQTLREDEIGVLMNSFAKMVLAVQVRERELAMALSESRELTSVTAESRRRVEAAHADLLATLETVPAALMIFNVDGAVRLRNRAATEVFGIEPHSTELRKNYWSRFKRMTMDGTAIPPEDWISARAPRRNRQERRARDSPSRRPRLPDSCQRRAVAQRTWSRRRSRRRVPGHLEAA